MVRKRYEAETLGSILFLNFFFLAKRKKESFSGSHFSFKIVELTFHIQCNAVELWVVKHILFQHFTD